MLAHGDLGGVDRLRLDDHVEHHVLVLVEEGGQPVNHLEDEGAEAPDVDGLVVRPLQDDLRRDVLGRADEALRALALFDHLGYAEVSEAGVAVFVKEHVLRLEVAVEDVLGVEVLQAEQDLAGVEAGLRLGEADALAKVVVEFAALLELHGEEDVAGRGEAVVEADDEGVADFLHDLFLIS